LTFLPASFQASKGGSQARHGISLGETLHFDLGQFGHSILRDLLLLILSKFNMFLISLEGLPNPDRQLSFGGSLMQLLKFKPPSIVYMALQRKVAFER
jgi:hypothetical protein